MDRIQGVTVAPGNQFTEGNPATATPATIVSAEWLNGVQEELIGVIDAASIVPSSADNGQVLDALNALYAPKVGTDSRLDTLEATATDHETRIDSLESITKRLEGALEGGASGLTVAENVWTTIREVTVPAAPAGSTFISEVNACFDGSASSGSVIGLCRVFSSAGGLEQTKSSFSTFSHADGTTFSVGDSMAGLTIVNGSTAKTVTLQVLVRNGTLSNVAGGITIRRLTGA